jgi:hypothetical protein
MMATKEQYDMKQIPTSMLALSVLTGWLFMMPAEKVAAESPQLEGAGVPEQEAGTKMHGGTYDGIDKKTKRIWIGDRVFRSNDYLQVVGSPSKAGLLSDIAANEKIGVEYLSGGNSTIPLAIRIYRQ